MTGPDASPSRWATVREVRQQPDIWRKHAADFARIASETRNWLAGRRYDEVWFCGAGTSAYIGETLSVHLDSFAARPRFRAVPTTDLVAAPGRYVRRVDKLLIVMFGRSGDSAESIGTLDILDEFAPTADRLHITSNARGALAMRTAPGPGRLRTIVLPEATNDSGFAMTSSYTTMLLVALACFDPPRSQSVEARFEALAQAASRILEAGVDELLHGEMPERLVFLGSGPLAGAARECALKVLELTAGRIATSWDTTLGFRHGPKAQVDERTQVLVLMSSNPHTRRYDDDLAAELVEQFGAGSVVRLGAADADVDVPTVENDAWSAVLHVIVAQLLAVGWSERLGLNVDDPFGGRNLTRVVSEVRIYPLPPAQAALVGAIDLGGSKIEACLFDGDLERVASLRVSTPRDNYSELLDAIVGQVHWLDRQAGRPVSVGIGIPGVIDPRTGNSNTANLPATGRALSSDLSSRLGRAILVENDCKCLALSEANGGAGAPFETVFGLVLGTGVGGGVCVDGALVRGLSGLPGEVGHIGIPATVVARHDLPVIACGCGRVGCYETLLSGPGMSRLARCVAGRNAEPAEIVRLGAMGDAQMQRVHSIWIELACDLIGTIQVTIDPDCVVIGGGLSRIEGLAEKLRVAFEPHSMEGARVPQFRTARFGDASGVRGAAMLARFAATSESAGLAGH